MSRWMRGLRRCWLALLLGMLTVPALAHEMSMAEMQLREVAPGDFLWQWGPSEKYPPGQVLRLQWPEGCTADATHVRCGEHGLAGRVSVEGVGEFFSAVLVKVNWRDGQTRVYTLTKAQPSVQLRRHEALPMVEQFWQHVLESARHLLWE